MSGKEVRIMGSLNNRGGNRQMGRPQNCMCPACGKTTPHTPGVPCRNMKCPQCGNNMMRG